MKKATQIFLATILLVLAAGPAMAMIGAHEISVKIPEIVELVVDSETIDFGEHTGPGSYERTDAVKITYRCNKKVGWELRVSATDFAGGEKSFSANQLSVRADKTRLSEYTPMIPGSYLVVDDNNNHVSARSKEVFASYQLNLTGEEYEGNYTSTVTYTLIIL